MARKVLLVPTLFLTLLPGCSDERLGDCTDPNQGRRPVEVGGKVMFAGQAIMVQSCASGLCHSARAKGSLRVGAPAGLDFDVEPVTATGLTSIDGQTVATVDPAELERLRAHQRKVFEHRDSIWKQVVRGLMPPENYERPGSPGKLFTRQGSSCVFADQPLGSLNDPSTREELRNWLACGTPVVETTSTELTTIVGGTVGDQYPSCKKEGGGDDPEPATFESVASMLSKECGFCHLPGGVNQAIVLNTPEAIRDALLGASGQGAPSNCDANPNPYVTPGDPSKSYILAVVGDSSAGESCTEPMPYGVGRLDDESLDLLKRWIEGGAPAQ
jgi:hypothetical protein